MRHLLICTWLASCACAGAQQKQALAEDVFKNIQMFKGMPAARVIPAMDALTGLLGVDCTYCHTPHEWEKDDKPAKPTARKMFEMIDYLNNEHFGGQNRISCWTCHHGHAKPPAMSPDPQRVDQAKQLMAIPASEEAKPAEEVFHNVQSLKGVPAGRFPMIMTFFSRALGVECTHCHVAGQWEKDSPAKQTARTMLAMVGATIHKFYGANGPVGCYTCHQGAVKPAFDSESSRK